MHVIIYNRLQKSAFIHKNVSAINKNEFDLFKLFQAKNDQLKTSDRLFTEQ